MWRRLQCICYTYDGAVIGNLTLQDLLHLGNLIRVLTIKAFISPDHDCNILFCHQKKAVRNSQSYHLLSLQDKSFYKYLP